jgi:SAM-dependent methyltransferase
MTSVDEAERGFGRLDPAEMQFTERACDLCGDGRSVIFAEIDYFGVCFKFVRCVSCGLIFQNPVLSSASRKHIYQSLDYWEARDALRSGDAAHPMLNYYAYRAEEAVRRRTARRYAAWIRSHLFAGARVIDLGCSDGVLVEELARTGLSACGIDISVPQIELGRARSGSDLKIADFDSDWDRDGQFDAVTCFAALSNIPAPSRIFRRIAGRLKSDGQFFFNFGDMDRVLSRMQGRRFYALRPTASVIFSTSTVRRYCAGAGLGVAEARMDCQFASLARLVAFASGTPLLRLLRSLGLDDVSFPLWLPNGTLMRARKASGAVN